jgi:hypothetical protein
MGMQMHMERNCILNGLLNDNIQPFEVISFILNTDYSNPKANIL